MDFEVITESFYIRPEPVDQAEPQLARSSCYDGPARNLTDGEARDHLSELLRYFCCQENFRLPSPPLHQPGFQNAEYPDAVLELLDLGVHYLSAAAKRQPRKMHLIAGRVEAYLRDIHNKAKLAGKAESDAAYMASLPEPVWRDFGQDKRAVYFISSDEGPIKIGIATDVKSRLKSLQTAHPAKLTLLAVGDGGQPQEREYHARFAAHRLHGEWFARHPDILAEIERLSTLPTRGIA